jgi:hypothetical protein
MDLEQLRYPLGRFTEAIPLTAAGRSAAIAQLAALPAEVRSAVDGLADAQLDTPYRPGGWTVRQLVHHLADSHMNALIRIKLALTEENPVIKPYDENAWATLPDARLPVDGSLAILNGVHEHWATTCSSLTEEQWVRTFVHPELGKVLSLEYHAQMYAWHCVHHVAHITRLRTREGW